MFEAYYGFEKTPFARSIAPGALYNSAQHQELLARLVYMVRDRGFALITGEIGSGKSTAVRALAASLDPARHHLLYVAQSGLTPRHLYRELCRQMSIEPAFLAADARRQLMAALWDSVHKLQRQPVVVIDEAHLLSAPLLEEVRFFFNHQMDSASPMALCLVGQAELRQRLRLQTFAAIAQRITMRYHLTGMPEPETRAYIEHHLSVAGVKHPLFSDDAARLIHQYSKGIPRQINNLCTAALLAGFAEQRRVIDESTVKQALMEFQDAVSD
ncbi:MAG: AAA family ATPase [Planctomycetes bacterium]|nr:AAA family ATPase [Planctomycetota bacterium]